MRNVKNSGYMRKYLEQNFTHFSKFQGNKALYTVAQLPNICNCQTKRKYGRSPQVHETWAPPFFPKKSMYHKSVKSTCRQLFMGVRQ